MTEADLLYHFVLVREQLDATISQTVGFTLAMLVGTYYFLHKAGWKLKTAVFAMYFIGWFTFVNSGVLAGEHLQAIIGELVTRIEAGEASPAAVAVAESMRSGSAWSYVITGNIGNFLMLLAAAGFLFFWKPPGESDANETAPEV